MIPVHFLKKRWCEQYPNHQEFFEVALLGLEHFLKMHKYVKNGLAMTSKTVDFLWHEFILDTRKYFSFCEDHVGYYVHHSPNESANPDKTTEMKGVLRSWIYMCQCEGIDYSNPQKLPILFYLDSLIIPESGHIYSLEQNPSNLLK